MSRPSPDQFAELLSLLAHDLRNPLSALLTNLNFLRSVVNDASPEVVDALSDSTASCAVLSLFIGNLDVMSRAFQKPLLGRPTFARKAVTEAVNRLLPQTHASDVEVELLPGAQDPRLLVEPMFLGRALDNVLANSLQYSPTNGKVRIECAAKRDHGVITVMDDGPKVSSASMELVLSAEGQRTAKNEVEARYGRGLGLYCAAEAARIAGAEVRLVERGARSAFEITAPLAV